MTRIAHRASWVLVATVLLGAHGCKAPSATALESPAPPELVIPSFAADDPRTGQAGFVHLVTLATTTAPDGHEFRLLAYESAETATLELGVIARKPSPEAEPFVGTATLELGRRALVVPFAEQFDSGDVDVPLEPDGTALVGSAIDMDDGLFRWVMIPASTALWFPPSEARPRGAIALNLTIRDRQGTAIARLPERGDSFAASIQPARSSQQPTSSPPAQ
jgi:hypothetical protein